MIFAESELWIETCLGSMGAVLGWRRDRVAMPWMKLVEAAKLVSVDEDMARAVRETTFGNSLEDAWRDEIIQMLGSCELTRDEMGRVLRRRSREE
jgi:RAD50-interacting protein 1